MMKESLFEKIKSLQKELDGYAYLETTDCEWFKTEDNVWWVDEDCSVYSGEFRQGSLSRNDSVLINIDTGCGDTVTMVFKKDKQLPEEDFYDKYEDFM